MQRLSSLEEYYALIKASKSRCGTLKTNCLLFPEGITRYIDLGRFYWEESEAGIIFYSDEADFYQMYYYLNSEINFTYERKEKPVLIQNVYKGEKKAAILAIEDQFEKAGFVHKDTMKHGVFVGQDNIPRIRRSLRPINRVMQKEGLQFAPLRRDQIPEMLAFCKSIDEIPFYQFPYFTEDEFVEEAETERLCCIMDSQGELVAVRHLIVNGKKAYGWVGIKEEYKGIYGLAIVFLCHALDYIDKNNIKMCSWVDEKNVPSLQYHDRLGTEWTGHLEDEWLLE